MLWSRRMIRDGAVPVTIEVDEREVRRVAAKTEAHATLGAGWSFVRAAQLYVELFKDGARAEDPSAEHRFHPLLSVRWDPHTTSHPEVEQKVGEALLAVDPRSEHAGVLFGAAAPLVLLEWPVGFRFGAIFEAHVGVPAAERALVDVATELAKRKAKLPGELARLCLSNLSRAALAPLLSLAEQGASFEDWMVVAELASEIDDPAIAPTLERLARGKVDKDVKDTLLAVAAELKKKR